MAGDVSRSENDGFVNLSLAISPGPRLSSEVELAAAHTGTRDIEFEHLCLTGRYLVWNDIVGDLVSLTTGVTITVSPTNAVEDLSVFHSDNVDLEGHIAIGKEHSKGSLWLWRYWSAVGLGWGFQDSAWLRFTGASEYNLDGVHQFRLLGEGLIGLGSNDLDLTIPFKGYGPIDHRSADLAFRYTYVIEYIGTISAEVKHRVYAKNYPKNATHAVLTFLYTFGL